MVCAEFQCAPRLAALMDRISRLRGRFVLEDAFAGKAVVGAEPVLMLTSKDGLTTLEENGSSRTAAGDPFEALRSVLARFRGEPIPGVPFVGGAVGYFSYDLGRVIERVPVIAAEDVPTPDYRLGFYDSALLIDFPQGRCTAVSWSGDERAVEFWRETARSASEGANDACIEDSCFAGPRPTSRSRAVGVRVDLSSNFTKPGYLRAIERVKKYIAAGDCYQVNLSQRFESELPCSPWELYKALRRINPAPHGCFMDLGDPVLVSASPESFLSYDPASRIVTTKPIKGTRPRGSTPEEDARLAAELAASEKDRAENLMIVDMERNDLGRVARYGSVRVPKLWAIEAHPNVFQMVSTVQAELAAECDPIDLLRAAFPGGSITGAPKVRAMEIIEELEPHRRGIYTGSAGFIDFSGGMELNIVIRSFVVHANRVYFHAGGGIVADSDPEAEYQETLDKVSGLAAALEEAGGRSG